MLTFLIDFMSLAEVAEASGLPARTIRFYIARGLLNGPVKAGRNAAYTAEHVAQLEGIKRLQTAGHTLSEIVRILGDGPSETEPEAVPHAVLWQQYAIAEDVILWVRAGGSPWRTKQLRGAVKEFVQRVGPGNNGRGEEGGGIR
jgi:DNA-binding transcriptional MerR regulator